jgi:hypothetical protein
MTEGLANWQGGSGYESTEPLDVFRFPVTPVQRIVHAAKIHYAEDKRITVVNGRDSLQRGQASLPGGSSLHLNLEPTDAKNGGRIAGLVLLYGHLRDQEVVPPVDNVDLQMPLFEGRLDSSLDGKTKASHSRNVAFPLFRRAF